MSCHGLCPQGLLHILLCLPSTIVLINSLTIPTNVHPHLPCGIPCRLSSSTNYNPILPSFKPKVEAGDQREFKNSQEPQPIGFCVNTPQHLVQPNLPRLTQTYIILLRSLLEYQLVAQKCKKITLSTKRHIISKFIKIYFLHTSIYKKSKKLFLYYIFPQSPLIGIITTIVT